MTSRPALQALRSSGVATRLRLFYVHFVTYAQDDGVYTQVDYVSQQSETYLASIYVEAKYRKRDNYSTYSRSFLIAFSKID